MVVTKVVEVVVTMVVVFRGSGLAPGVGVLECLGVELLG